MTKIDPQHFDKLGNELFVGDYVVAPYGNRQTIIARVRKLNPIMLGLQFINRNHGFNTYPSETVKLDQNLVTMYLLKNKQ